MPLRSPAVLLAAVLCCCATQKENAGPEGDWAGSLKVGNYWAFITLRFEKQGGTVAGTLEIPRIPWKTTTGKVALDGDRLRFEAKSADGSPLVFDGTLDDGTLHGPLDSDGEKGTFHLWKIDGTGQDGHAGHAGDYETRGGSTISITRYDPGNKETWLALHDARSGIWGLLYPTSKDTFRFGPVRASSFADDLTVTFEGAGVELRRGRAAPTEGTRTETFDETPVEFMSGEVKLSGTLLTPEEKDTERDKVKPPFPALVMVHGSGAESRDGTPASPNYTRHVALRFVRSGTAVLLYDKRGVGASAGDWNRASFDDLADDVLAAVKFLKGRPEIRPDAVGLWGISQAGWVISSAVARSDEVAFVILVGGGGVSPTRQELYRRERNLRKAGFSEEEIKAALEHQAQKFDLVRRNDLEGLNAANAAAKGEKWFSHVGNPEAGASWDYWRGVIDFDPLPNWQKYKGPMLLVFGAHDESGPVHEALDAISKALRKGGNSNLLPVIVPGADHILLKTGEGPESYPSLASHYFDMMTDWLSGEVRPRGLDEE
jgi:pimeloyl-ACP methyl ester carboxylesterase